MDFASKLKLPPRPAKIAEVIMYLLLHDPNGYDIDTIGNYVLANVSGSNRKEVGPVLFVLLGAELVTSSAVTNSDGQTIIFKRKELQWLKPGFINRFHCKFTGHDVPSDLAFETQMAVFRGGYCRRCGEFIRNEFLGDCWTREESMDGFIRLSGYDVSFATKLGLKVVRLC
jgi:hypothetical protein